MAQAQERSSEPGDRRLLFATLGPPAAWIAHLLIAYVLVPYVCAAGGLAAMYLVTLVLALVAAAGGFVAWRTWRDMGEEERGSLFGDMEGTRKGFMAFFGILSGGLFFFAIFLATLPMFFVNPCTHGARI